MPTSSYVCRECGSKQTVEHFGFGDSTAPVCHGFAMAASNEFSSAGFSGPSVRNTFSEATAAASKALSRANWELLNKDEEDE